MAMPVPSDTLSNNNSLLAALFIAVIVHIVVVLGMNFKTPPVEPLNKPIDITLVNMPVEKAPEKTDFLAPENQIGAGKETQKPEPPAQKLPSEENSPAKEVKKKVHEETKLKVAQKIIAPPKDEKKVTKKILTQPKSEKKVVATHNTAEEVSQPKKPPQLTAESLQQQIAQLGTAIRQSQPSAEEAKIKFVDSVSAHKYVAAQYMKDWETKVERMGNLNYPEEATKKNFSGTLTMDVGIKSDGSVYSIRISRSSGNPALDEAAIKIVRMSAPFAPLPLELGKELDVLVITRVWKFSDESGLVTR